MSATTTNPITETHAAGQTSGGADKLPFWDRFSDRVNPILVKETRQAFKGRGFMLTFGLLLASCWMVSVIGGLSAGASLEYYSYAMQFFTFYFIPLAAAIGIVVPFLAYTSMLNERMDDTFEMLSITSLNARRIVNGKLINSIVQILLFYSAIAPFIAFTSLLQGFQIMPVVFVLVLSFCWSVCLCALGLLVSTLAENRLVQGFLSLVFIGFLILCFSSSFNLMGPMFWTMPVVIEVILSLAGIVLLLTAVTFLIREIAVAQITFESDNRSSGIRLVCTILIVGFWLFLPIMAGVTGMPISAWPSIIGTWTIISCIFLAPVLLFICTEPVEMSRRVRKQVQSIAESAGVLAFPYLPGCARGYVFILVHLLPLLIICMMANGTSYDQPLDFAVFCVLYLLVYAGLASFMSQLFRQFSANARTAHIRTIFLITISIGAIIPHLVVAMLEANRFGRVEYSPLMLSSPFATFFHAADNPGSMDSSLTGVAFVLALTGFILLLFNAGAIGRSMAETFTYKNLKPKSLGRSYHYPSQDGTGESDTSVDQSSQRNQTQTDQIPTDQTQTGPDA